jgi:hypothetical protein
LSALRAESPSTGSWVVAWRVFLRAVTPGGPLQESFDAGAILSGR